VTELSVLLFTASDYPFCIFNSTASDYPFVSSTLQLLITLLYLQLYSFWLPFCIFNFTASDYPFCIFKFTVSDYPFCIFNFTTSDYPFVSSILQLLITPFVSSTLQLLITLLYLQLYSFWLPLIFNFFIALDTILMIKQVLRPAVFIVVTIRLRTFQTGDCTIAHNSPVF
jgi:hypothetical protein